MKAFGAASNLPNSRSAEQEEIGLFYGLINAQVQVNRNLRNLAAGPASDRRHRRFVAILRAGNCHDGRRVRRMLGFEAVSYNFWRPVTAIQHADIDGNAATDADPAWMPQIVTPTHPEYPPRTAA